MAQIDRLDRPEAALFAGAYTLRETAVLLRATTPPPGTNPSLWKRRHDTFIEATAYHLAQWIRSRHGVGGTSKGLKQRSGDYVC